jgi:hypothetical protein
MIAITEKFSSLFGGSIGGDGLNMEILFGERDSLTFSINRRGRSEDKVFDSKLSASLQKDDRPSDIHILVEERIRDGGSYPGSCSQMDDEVNSILTENLMEMITISNIACDEFKLGWKFSRQSLYVLDLGGGIIVGVEVVETNHMGPFSQETFAEMRTDKPCAAGDKKVLHQHSLTPHPYRRSSPSPILISKILLRPRRALSI